MKREEKNQQTKRRIMDSALKEFSEKGYGASSVNAICSAQGISKGIIYHYFDTKDSLFLSCIEECFVLLTEYLNCKMQNLKGSAKEQLEEYFSARLLFFVENPVYQRIFCEAIISPPLHLKDEIEKARKEFDILNIGILQRILSSVSLNPNIAVSEVIDTFRQFQDFINAKYQVMRLSESEFEEHEKSCKKAMDILLYGVVERKE